jgi:hypothetical protein
MAIKVKLKNGTTSVFGFPIVSENGKIVELSEEAKMQSVYNSMIEMGQRWVLEPLLISLAKAYYNMEDKEPFVDGEGEVEIKVTNKNGQTIRHSQTF